MVNRIHAIHLNTHYFLQSFPNLKRMTSVKLFIRMFMMFKTTLQKHDFFPISRKHFLIFNNLLVTLDSIKSI